MNGAEVLLLKNIHSKVDSRLSVDFESGSSLNLARLPLTTFVIMTGDFFISLSPGVHTCKVGESTFLAVM